MWGHFSLTQDMVKRPAAVHMPPHTCIISADLQSCVILSFVELTLQVLSELLFFLFEFWRTKDALLSSKHPFTSLMSLCCCCWWQCVFFFLPPQSIFTLLFDVCDVLFPGTCCFVDRNKHFFPANIRHWF